MSPSVERKEFNGDTEFNGDIGQVPVIMVSLADSEPFNSDKFDKLVEDSMKPESGMYFLKYIVYADIMYIFPARLLHNAAHSLFVANGVTDSPQSAGMVGIESDNPSNPFRIISDNSATLSNEGILTRFDSDKYKRAVIKKRLGEFFGVI